MSQACECGCGGALSKATQRFLVGHNNRGKCLGPPSAETRQKIAATKIGPLNPGWKGEDAGYAAIHNWLHRNRTKAGICERCGAERHTEWANLSGLYKRDFADYVELCAPCHRRFDYARARIAEKVAA